MLIVIIYLCYKIITWLVTASCFHWKHLTGTRTSVDRPQNPFDLILTKWWLTQNNIHLFFYMSSRNVNTFLMPIHFIHLWTFLHPRVNNKMASWCSYMDLFSLLGGKLICVKSVELRSAWPFKETAFLEAALKYTAFVWESTSIRPLTRETEEAGISEICN